MGGDPNETGTFIVRCALFPCSSLQIIHEFVKAVSDEFLSRDYQIRSE